jgi:hypothetical protein
MCCKEIAIACVACIIFLMSTGEASANSQIRRTGTYGTEVRLLNLEAIPSNPVIKETHKKLGLCVPQLSNVLQGVRLLDSKAGLGLLNPLDLRLQPDLIELRLEAIKSVSVLDDLKSQSLSKILIDIRPAELRRGQLDEHYGVLELL